jgi:hypothetical protein
MHKGAIIAGLVVATILHGSAQSAADRNRPKCDFHVFADMNDHWALSEGTPKRKWLVINVGDAPVIVKGSEITTPQHPEHEELIATGESTIATMKYGQPEIHMVPAVEPPVATGNMTSGDNAADANTRTAGADAPRAAGATTTVDANVMAGGEKPPPTLKTTVVICRFFERR